MTEEAMVHVGPQRPKKKKKRKKVLLDGHASFPVSANEKTSRTSEGPVPSNVD
jgi:hypothetical protein